MIILPQGLRPGEVAELVRRDGPVRAEELHPELRRDVHREPEFYWGPKPKPAGHELHLLRHPDAGASAPWSAAPSTSSASSRWSGGEQLLSGGYNIIKLKSSAHRELSMRNDVAPFTDARVRQAIALTLNRPQIVQALFKGFADVGNDSPFAPVFPSTDTSVAQRAQDIAKAKSLLSAAGQSQWFLHSADRQPAAGDPAVRLDCSASGQGHRRQYQRQGRVADGVLRQGHVRELRLARRDDEPGRLRAPQRAQRVPDRAAADHQRQGRYRLVERRPLQQLPVRQAVQAVHRGGRPPARRSSSPVRSSSCC